MTASSNRQIDGAVERIVAELPTLLPRHRRHVIALAGPPAAGKTTLATALEARVGPSAAVLGLDAFHFDNRILEQRGDLDRKGAPHTFDCAAFGRTLGALRNSPQESISIPQFDRRLELSRNCAELVGPGQHIVITEGNYLLLDVDPWSALDDLFDFTVLLTARIKTIEARIIDRWRRLGYSDSDARERATSNDLPNAELVLAESRPADLIIDSG